MNRKKFFIKTQNSKTPQFFGSVNLRVKPNQKHGYSKKFKESLKTTNKLLNNLTNNKVY